MPFTTNHTLLETYNRSLETISDPTPVQSLVRRGIPHLLESPTIFSACISMDSPFTEEFFEKLKTGDISHDGCFAVFECLVIFFREKWLRLGNRRADTVERDILHYFETSPEWNENLGTLICAWYWRHLPRRVMNDVRRQSGGEEFVDMC